MIPCCCIAENKWSNTLWSTKSFWTFSHLHQTNRGRWESWKPLRSFQDENCWNLWLMRLLWCEQEMIESIREAVVYMAHTHDGARVAMHCLWHGTAKVRAHKNTQPTTNGILKVTVTFLVKDSSWSHILSQFNQLSLNDWSLNKLKWSETHLFCGFSVGLYILSESNENVPRDVPVCFLGFRTEKSSSKQWRRTWSSLPLWVSFYIYRKKGLMRKWKERESPTWITQSFNSKYFIRLSSSITAVKNQKRVMWAQCDVAQHIWQLQQNSWSQPEQNWLVCFSPQQTRTLEAGCLSIQLKYTVTCQRVLNYF